VGCFRGDTNYGKEKISTKESCGNKYKNPALPDFYLLTATPGYPNSDGFSVIPIGIGTGQPCCLPLAGKPAGRN